MRKDFFLEIRMYLYDTLITGRRCFMLADLVPRTLADVVPCTLMARAPCFQMLSHACSRPLLHTHAHSFKKNCFFLVCSNSSVVLGMSCCAEGCGFKSCWIPFLSEDNKDFEKYKICVSGKRKVFRGREKCSGDQNKVNVFWGRECSGIKVSDLGISNGLHGLSL